MASLPSYDMATFLTKDEFRAETAELRAEFKGDLHRLFLAWMGGHVVLLGAILGVAFIP